MGVTSLCKSVGGETIERSGSAVSFRHGQLVEVFPRPHPAKEAKQYQVRAAGAFLAKIGGAP